MLASSRAKAITWLSAPIEAAVFHSRKPAETLDRLYDGVLVLDLDWRVSYVSVPGARMLKREAADLTGRDIWEEFPEAVGGTLHVAYEEALTDGEPRLAIGYDEASGVWFEGRVFPEDDHLILLFRDVTESKRAEIALELNLEGVAAAEEIVGFGIWEWDIAGGRVHWSDELHRIYGLAPGAFGGTVDALHGVPPSRGPRACVGEHRPLDGDA